MGGVASHFLATQDVEDAEARDGLLAHAAYEDVDEFFAEAAAEAAEACAGDVRERAYRPRGAFSIRCRIC